MKKIVNRFERMLGVVECADEQVREQHWKEMERKRVLERQLQQ